MFKNSKQIDIINGPIFSRILLLTIPIMLSGLLQLAFNAADIIVVGKYSGHLALAAVGSTSSSINLIVSLFMGISVGASIVIGRYYGARELEKTNTAIKTAFSFALIAGFILLFAGLFLARPLLELLNSPKDVIDLATQYMRIYFLAMPALMIYNFGSAILRVLGDSKRPLYYLIIAGIVNVLLNLVLVIGFNMSVKGVAIATALSYYVSATLIILSLINAQDFTRLDLNGLKINKSIFLEMLRLGIPAAFQGIIFSISNVLIQSSINQFSDLVVAGNSAAANLEGFAYIAMSAVYQATLAFVSQNYGAKKYDRINKILIRCIFLVTCIGLIIGNFLFFFGSSLLRLYTDQDIVVEYGLNRLLLISSLYFLCGIMDVIVGAIRGLGYSLLPMFTSIVGICIFRSMWVFTVFKIYFTPISLYISYPVSWLITGIANFICYVVIKRKINLEAKMHEASNT